MAITFDPVLTLCWNLNSVDKFSSSLTKKFFITIGWVGKKLDGGGRFKNLFLNGKHQSDRAFAQGPHLVPISTHNHKKLAPCLEMGVLAL